MSRKVFKYVTRVSDDVMIRMSKDAEIIHVGQQGQADALVVWAVVDPGAETEVRKLHVRGTGYELDDTVGPHIGSYQAGPFVWHVFEDQQQWYQRQLQKIARR